MAKADSVHSTPSASGVNDSASAAERFVIHRLERMESAILVAGAALWPAPSFG